MFRKNACLFHQSEATYIIILILCLTLIPILGIGLSLIYMLPFIVLILVNPKLYNEYITINEFGISSQKSGEELWKYEWDKIAELKKSSRFLMPSVEVIAYNKCGESEQYAHTNHYFQLNKVAKKAIEIYYKPTEKSRS